MKKVGKTTRLFRYDLDQIPYDYTVGVMNRFKGLDLIECLKNICNMVLEVVIKTIPKKKKWKKAKWLLKKPYKWLRKEEKQKAKVESK